MYPNLATTEANWQAEKTNSKLGQCGKFVVDDTAGTIRLPCVVNAQGLVDLALIGGIKSESLPNIIGAGIFTTSESASGAVFDGGSAINYSTGSSGTLYQPKNGGFSASRSSSTYQDNAPVQQEAVQYPYYIQVATGVEETLPAIREYKINTPFFFGQSIYSDVAPDNASWLVSNGQYNARSVYPDYYDWLLEQMNAGVSGFVASTDTYTDYDFVINTADQTFRLPLKTKLASGNAVVGNGMTLGMTNGTTNFGVCGTTNDYWRLAASEDAYGKNTQATTTSDTQLSGYLGVTTDPTKSGIETSSNGLKLYFYVGDTVQDASLINAGAVLGQLSNKADASQFQVVSALPANPDTNVFYFIPE